MANDMRLKEQKDVLDVGRLIKLLELEDGSKELRFDFCGFRPSGELDSYRGYYSDLALHYDRESSTTVSQLIALLKDSIGSTITGYKGGDYPVFEDTKVWVSQYGMASGTAIVGVKEDFYVYLLTAQID